MKRFLQAAFAILICASHADARDANHLLGASSPYLLQHLYNPVDWYPWGPDALQKARDENKLILVSVGFSSCHWCHVMAQESFEDEEIARVLNTDFVSIKIDRESRPDLDEQFMLATEILTGGRGWPNTVILTPMGDPFFAGTYFPPDAFLAVLDQVQRDWKDDPAQITDQAASLAQAINGYLTQRAEAREVTPTAIAEATDRVLEELDPFHGGYGVAPKFPREPLFLYLLSEADRKGDPTLLAAVTDMLDSMIVGGIHDHVGGGFHRYAVDPEWHVPHFEKMLYTQALTGRLLLRAWGMTGKAHYRRAATRTLEYVLRDLRHPDGAFYSAEDASSENDAGQKTEGAYYLWTADALATVGAESGFARHVFDLKESMDLHDGEVLSLSALPSDLAEEMARTAPALVADLDAVLDRMFIERASRARPFRDEKIVLSWNAMMIQTLAEAGYRLREPRYLRAAEDAARSLLATLKTSDGLMRVSFDGSVGVAGQLADYAGLGLALIALHDYAADRATADAWLREAAALANEVRTRFGVAKDGFRMVALADGLTEIIPQDDTEIPSGNALALELFTAISTRMPAPEIERDAFDLAAALSDGALERPERRGFALKAITALQDGETGPVRFAAKGAVRTEVRPGVQPNTIDVVLSIADGWHINANAPLDDFLVPTELDIEDAATIRVTYPTPVVKTLAISGDPQALYEGEATLTVKMDMSPSPDQRPPAARLSLQACSDEICLQPETLTFTLWGK